MPALDAGQEIQRIQKALQQREAGGEVKTDVLPHAVAADLREKLRTFRPHVIHFIGHGGFQDDQGMLVMEDDERKTRFVSDRQFREFFLGADDAKLVILNVCQGATQSSARALAGLAPQVVRRGLGAVVAMQYPIPDKVALSFAREFYRALAQYYPVDAAVTEGRRAVYQDFGSDRPDWGTPVIFMRSPDGVLFSPPETQPPAHRRRRLLSTSSARVQMCETRHSFGRCDSRQHCAPRPGRSGPVSASATGRVVFGGSRLRRSDT